MEANHTTRIVRALVLTHCPKHTRERLATRIVGKEPKPLTPEILHLLNKLEPDKDKQTRLLTEHLAGQRLLP
jgi:hypothetical protein